MLPLMTEPYEAQTPVVCRAMPASVPAPREFCNYPDMEQSSRPVPQAVLALKLSNLHRKTADNSRHG